MIHVVVEVPLKPPTGDVWVAFVILLWTNGKRRIAVATETYVGYWRHDTLKQLSDYMEHDAETIQDAVGFFAISGQPRYSLLQVNRKSDGRIVWDYRRGYDVGLVEGYGIAQYDSDAGEWFWQENKCAQGHELPPLPTHEGSPRQQLQYTCVPGDPAGCPCGYVIWESDGLDWHEFDNQCTGGCTPQKPPFVPGTPADARTITCCG